MMDPVSLTVEGITTLVVTKSLEKLGEAVGEGVVKLVTQIQQRLVSRIPRLKPALETAPEKLLEKETILEIEAEVFRDPELLTTMQALLQAVGSDPVLQQEVAKVIQQSRQIALKGNEAQNIEVDELIQETSGSGSGTQESTMNNKVTGTIKVGKIQQINRG